MNKYECYKKVELSWLKEIPQHWSLIRVKNIFEISKDLSYKENPIVLSLARDKVKVRNISKNKGQLAESYNNYNTVKIGDLLLNPMDLYSGANCNVSQYNGVISPAYVNLRTKENVCVKYYDYIFKIQYTSLAFQSVGKGVSFNNRWTLSNETLLNYFVLYPPFSEQKKIANYLDWKIREIDKLIELEKQKIVELELLKQNFIDKTIESIDSEYIPFKAVFDLGKGLSITKDNLGENGVKCINYGEIHSDLRFSFFSFDKKLKGLEKTSGVTISSYANLECGNFIFADTSEDIDGCGNFTYLEDSMEKVYAGYHTIVCKLKINVTFKYLAYYFESDKWRKQVKKNVKGVKVYSITQGILKSTKVQIPSEEQQNNIVELLDNYMEIYRKLNACIDNKISELIKLKESLISEVVTGQIDVRNVKILERK